MKEEEIGFTIPDGDTFAKAFTFKWPELFSFRAPFSSCYSFTTHHESLLYLNGSSDPLCVLKAGEPITILVKSGDLITIIPTYRIMEINDDARKP
jgi:hypothetical protein